MRPVFLLAVILAIGCGRSKEENKNLLVRYGDRELTYDEVVDMIPEGLHPADSAAMFHQLVDAWIRSEVLADFAEERLYDMEAIDQRVREYRNQLIVMEYLSRMRETQKPRIEEQKVKEYYDLHRGELKLEVPLVRGVFLKINSSAKGKEDIKNLISSDNPEDIDRLEREWLDLALEYNYFRDKWIDWETISMLIPHRFGNPDEFLRESDYFETEYGDCSYYLKVTDYMPSGEEQPYEYARNWIAEVLTQGALTDYENSLVESLVNKAVKEGKMETFLHER